MLDHATLWIAIDRLAAREGISVSALARRAGLDPTSFNISKRHVDNRPRWPSTENLMQLLRVTNTSINAFVALAKGGKTAGLKVPQLAVGKATPPLLALPGFADPRLCAMVITARHRSCLYPRGTILLLSPGAKPRRGAMIVLKLRLGTIRIGRFDGQTSTKLHLTGDATKTATAKVEKIPRDDIIECCPIVWTRESAV